MKTAVLGALLIILAAAPTYAVGTCLDKSRVHKILKDYRWKVQTPQKTYIGIGDVDLCDATGSAEFRVFEAIIFLEDLAEKSNRQLDDLDRGLIKTSFIEYFKSKPKSIIFDSGEEETCEGSDTMGYSDTERSALHICPSAGKVSTLKMAEVLIHESRHLDENGFGHMPCSQGIYKSTGDYACDNSFETGGAYAYSAEFFVRVSRALNISTELRNESRGLAYATFLYHFNKMPLDLKEGLFSQEENGRVSFYDGSKVEPLFSVNPINVMTLRFDAPTFYDADKVQVKSYYSPELVVDAQGAYAREYIEKFRSSRRHAVVDINYFRSADGNGIYSCRLFLTELECADSRGAMSEPAVIPLSGIIPKGFYLLNNRLTVLDSSGKYTVLPMTFVELRAKKFSDFQQIKISDAFGAQVKWKQVSYGTTEEGIVQRMEPSDKMPQVVPGFENLKIKKLIGPAFYSTKLNSL